MSEVKPQNKKRKHPERIEQKKVVQFLWLMKEYGHVVEYTATAQATYTGWSQISINQQLGVKKGLPDLIVVLKKQKAPNENRLVFIEMKHPGSSKPKDEQVAWISALNKVRDVLAVVCYSGEEAIRFLTEMIGDISCPKDGESFEQFLNKSST